MSQKPGAIEDDADAADVLCNKLSDLADDALELFELDLVSSRPGVVIRREPLDLCQNGHGETGRKVCSTAPLQDGGKIGGVGVGGSGGGTSCVVLVEPTVLDDGDGLEDGELDVTRRVVVDVVGVLVGCKVTNHRGNHVREHRRRRR